jgi:diguanylate cyclase (GGDEF)-like protein
MDTENQTGELPFEGFDHLIRTPLQGADEPSFKRIKRALLDIAPNHTAPFAYLIKRLVGRSFQEQAARNHWQSILAHKQTMEQALNRTISVQTAAVDYFCIEEDRTNTYARPLAAATSPTPPPPETEAWLHRIYAPEYHLERLKNELMRSKRYSHALSAILLDIDQFHTINERFSSQSGDLILQSVVKIIRLTIRSVDDIARYSGDRFLVILPETNRREAVELAERLRKNIATRTQRISGLSQGVTVTLSVGQCEADDQPLQAVKRLEAALERGKRQQRNAVYAL